MVDGHELEADLVHPVRLVRLQVLIGFVSPPAFDIVPEEGDRLCQLVQVLDEEVVVILDCHADPTVPARSRVQFCYRPGVIRGARAAPKTA